jgi:pimeloyl-ACP methyl ester carboxylesterase
MPEPWSRASTADGQTFVYGDSGTGPLVVLFHGFPDTPHSWDGIAAALATAGYRTVRPFLRGYHRETIVPGRPYDILTNGRDAIRLLDALDEPEAVLVGHDWGATMVYSAVAQHPERVRAICTVAIPHARFLPRSPATLLKARHFVGFRMPWAEAATRRDDFAYLDALYRRWAPNWAGPAREECLERVKACFSDERCLHEAIEWYRALSLSPPPEIARPPDVRGLIVGGTADIVPPEPFRQTAAALADGSDVMIAEGAGHWPHREAEADFTARLIDFLGKIG